MENNLLKRSEKLPTEEKNQQFSKDESLSKTLSLKERLYAFLRKKKWLFVIVGAALFLYSMYKNGQPNTESIFSFHVPLPDIVKTNEAMARQQEAAAKNQRIGGDADKLKIDTIQVSSYTVNYGSSHKGKMRDTAKTMVKLVPKDEIKPSIPSKKPTKELTISKITRNRIVTNNEKKDSVFVKHEEDGFNTTVISTVKINEKKLSEKKSDFVKAAIYGNQVIRSGSTVRIRLLENLQANGVDFPPNSIGTGIAMLNGNRVAIALTSIKNIAVKLFVYDKDLLPGIAFWGSDKVQEGIRNNGNESLDRLTDNALYNLPYGSVLGAGADLAKGLSRSIRYGAIQKKIGEIQLEEGYKIFIKSEQ